METKLSKLLDLASAIIPAIGALAKDDKSEKLALAVVDVVKNVVKEDDPKKAQDIIDADPKVKAELKKQLAVIAEKKAEQQNLILEEQQQQELDGARKSLLKQEEDHKEQLELIQKDIKSTNAARKFAQKSALSGGWTSWINPFLSIVITAAFLFFVYYIAKTPLTPADGTPGADQLNNEKVFLVAFGALATAFVTVISFHFGSSSGSKRKTQLQRIYGTKGAVKSNTSGTAVVTEKTASQRATQEKTAPVGTDHSFEAFWNTNLSHIKHFNWEELLFKGASNARFNSNTDPDPRLYPNVVPLVNALDKIRSEIDAPIKLISVYRSPAYNRNIGGATSSRHMQFDAADFVALGPTAGNSDRWQKIAKKLRANGEFQGGIGVYDSFVHIDTRGSNADWDNR